MKKEQHSWTTIGENTQARHRRVSGAVPVSGKIVREESCRCIFLDCVAAGSAAHVSQPKALFLLNAQGDGFSESTGSADSYMPAYDKGFLAGLFIKGCLIFETAPSA